MSLLVMDPARQFQRAYVGGALSRRLARGLRGVDRAALVETLGISESLLRQWLDGHALRAIDALALESALGLNAEYLLGGAGPSRARPGEKSLRVWRQFLRVRAGLASGRIHVARYRGRFDQETWREYWHGELAMPLARGRTVVVVDFRGVEFTGGVVREAYRTIDAQCQRYSSGVVALLRQARPVLPCVVCTRIGDALDFAELLTRHRAAGAVFIVAGMLRFAEECRLDHRRWRRWSRFPELARVADDLDLLPDELAAWRRDPSRHRQLSHALRALYAGGSDISPDTALGKLVVPPVWRSRRLKEWKWQPWS